MVLSTLSGREWLCPRASRMLEPAGYKERAIAPCAARSKNAAKRPYSRKQLGQVRTCLALAPRQGFLLWKSRSKASLAVEPYFHNRHRATRWTTTQEGRWGLWHHGTVERPLFGRQNWNARVSAGVGLAQMKIFCSSRVEQRRAKGAALQRETRVNETCWSNEWLLSLLWDYDGGS